MEAAHGRRRLAVIAALAFVLAAAALWASVSLAGGPGSSGTKSSKPTAGQVADSSTSFAPVAKRSQRGARGHHCPNRGDQTSFDLSSL